MGIESFVGVLHESIKIVQKEKIWIMENFFMELFQREEEDMC